MLSTAEHLSKITDSSRFEALGSAYLREKYLHLSVLIDTGQNVKGETIKGKVDGFTEYSKNKFALVQYTTNDSALDYKWLSKNEKKLGDLPKALLEIKALSASRPSATFEIYLVTHQLVSPELAKKVAHFGAQDNLSIIIAENSAISHYLDNNGQYLRHKFLGIRQDLISEELLRDISWENVEKYRLESSIKSDFLANLEEREKWILDIYHEANPLCILLGESGLGKSTALYTCMNGLSLQGALCLRIRPKIIAGSNSLADALMQQLRSDYPDLYVTETLLANLIHHKALIIVDDVNRFSNPQSVITHLRFLSRTTAPFSYKIICPVWPKYWEIDPADKDGSETIRALPAADGKAAAKVIEKYASALNVPVSSQLTRSIVKDLGGDLLLIGLYCDELSTAASLRSSTGKSVFLLQSFVDAWLDQVSKRNQVPLYSLAVILATFGEMMLKQRTWSPHYEEIRRWFRAEPEVIHHLNLLQADQMMFHFDPSGEIIYRHDRLRDTILAKGFQRLLERTRDHREIIADPYSAELAAIAVATGILTQDDCDLLMSLNPLAIFHALKFAQDLANSAKYPVLLSSIQRWRKQQAQSSWLLPEVREIGLCLLQFDVADINEVVDTIPITIEIALAKFRSGDLVGALQYFTFGDSTAPFSRNIWQEQVVGHVNLNHRDRLIMAIRSINPETFPAGLRASLYRLCGFLQSDKLVAIQYALWSLNPDKEEYQDYLWGILQSAAGTHREIIEDALAVLQTFSDVPRDPKYQSKNEKSEFLMTFSIIQWSLSEEQIELLADIGRANKDVAGTIAQIFDGLDSPAAVTFVVDYLCKRSGADPTTEETREPTTIGWKLSDRTREMALSNLALEALGAVWQDRSKSTPRRKLAFDIWKVRASEQDVIARSRAITTDDAALYVKSIRARVSLGDHQAAEAIKTDISTSKLFWKLECIWSKDIQTFLLNLIEKEDLYRDRRFMAAFWDLLLSIPDANGAAILTSHWEKLKLFWQAIPTALYLSTDATRELARERIYVLGFQNWPSLKEYYLQMMHGTVAYVRDTDPLSYGQRSNLTFLSESFRHLHHIYGFLDRDRSSKLARERLDSLLPYMELLQDFSHRDLADACIRRGWQDWLVEHLYPVMSDEDKKRFRPTDDDLLEELYGISTGNIIGQAFSFNERRNRLGISTERILRVLSRFSKTNRSHAGLEVLCFLLQIFGERSHLGLIEIYEVTGDVSDKEVTRLKVDAQYIIRRRSMR
jgi:hypothetical protein